MKVVLSKRAKELLLIIDKRTDRDFTTGAISIYFVPLGAGNDNVWGAGDARSLNSLERKGLIQRMPVAEYSFAITEEGRLIAQTLG
ncbi:MAG: hypothetical protein Q8O55_08745 [Dehalococcoidales bacterium]|nr:hypothetical protein [Dehalococcoidales bacterium]